MKILFNFSNALKSTKKLLENFFFTFDPMRDYNIEVRLYKKMHNNHGLFIKKVHYSVL